MDPERIKLLLELLREYTGQLEPDEYKEITVQTLTEDLEDFVQEELRTP